MAKSIMITLTTFFKIKTIFWKAVSVVSLLFLCLFEYGACFQLFNHFSVGALSLAVFVLPFILLSVFELFADPKGSDTSHIILLLSFVFSALIVIRGSITSAPFSWGFRSIYLFFVAIPNIILSLVYVPIFELYRRRCLKHGIRDFFEPPDVAQDGDENHG
jgi:hypothetical protein